ncbi:MAG: alanine--tRNA ligase [Chloroflexota bacterium]
MNATEIRRAFIDFFVERGHLHLPGLPLVSNDPNVTTLFAIAGMQQMIPFFMGLEQPPGPNMVTVQKAIRTNDIEDVGDDSHLTYLEMLGNFSVGNIPGSYFKRGAILHTWDFLVNVLGIPAEKWWAVTYPNDDAARDAWLEAGVPAERIGSTSENWWGPPGNAGPCGPNSEIHYDRGQERGCGGPDCRPEHECCDRFVEIWNDVFMSYFQDESGSRRELPWNNVDTGMGFERLVSVAQGVPSPYETDLFQPIIQTVAALAGKSYGEDRATDLSLRIIADHARAASFIVSEGVMPSSESRGYVVRRLIRRAALRGHLLGIDRPFLTAPVEVLIEILSGYHERLAERRDHILTVIREEESRFLLTLERGLAIFTEMAEHTAGGTAGISGHDAFTLYDTHGFPLELTRELAAERNLRIDEAGFAHELHEQRARARDRRQVRNIGASSDVYSSLSQDVPATIFTGYDELRSTTTVATVMVEGEPVGQVEEGDEAELILLSTPFYAESGGQVGDLGTIRSNGAVLRVLGTSRPFAQFISHRVHVEEGSLDVGDVVEAEVDVARRLHILPHHSGTHLLHKALQEVLGPEATQAGSLVAPDHLRFDFRWPKALSADEIREVQDRVNAAIWANLPVRREVMPQAEALQQGAMALFVEKYGDEVRVISMGDYSKELCGGTHVDATGDIGSLLITEEQGIGSGIRRIAAVAGAAAYTYVNELRDEMQRVTAVLDAAQGTMLARVQQLVQNNKSQEKRLQQLTQQLATNQAESLLRGAHAVDGFELVAQRITADSQDYLEATTDALKSRLDRGIVVLGTVIESKPAFTMGVTPNLASEGYSARQILGEAARRAQGGAGGTAEFAQGGGRDASKLDEVLNEAVSLIKQRAKNRHESLT